MTMREIGMALGVVESRVSQIHASAVLHLRSALSDLSTRTQSPPKPRKNGAKAPERTERAERPAATLSQMRVSN
jgi:RNA polymerase sigma factor for flagellar operon FliA